MDQLICVQLEWVKFLYKSVFIDNSIRKVIKNKLVSLAFLRCIWINQNENTYFTGVLVGKKYVMPIIDLCLSGKQGIVGQVLKLIHIIIVLFWYLFARSIIHTNLSKNKTSHSVTRSTIFFRQILWFCYVKCVILKFSLVISILENSSKIPI